MLTIEEVNREVKQAIADSVKRGKPVFLECDHDDYGFLSFSLAIRSQYFNDEMFQGGRRPVRSCRGIERGREWCVSVAPELPKPKASAFQQGRATHWIWYALFFTALGALTFLV